jgi:tagatose-6-phosphate ketose/aldose isomerase
LGGDLELFADQSARQGGEATASEIVQQPAVWREVNNLLASGRHRGVSSTAAGRSRSTGCLDGRRHIGLCGRDPGPALSRRTGRRVDAVATTDIVSNPEECFADDRPTLLVSFARSGNSPESVAATEFADRFLLACHHLVLTCDRSGRLYEKHT